MFASGVRMTMIGWMLIAYFGQVGPSRRHARSSSLDDLRRVASHIPRVAESKARYKATMWARSEEETLSSEDPSSASASEIRVIEAMHRGILADPMIERWRFDSVRARYLALLKRVGHDPAVEKDIRMRLAGISRQEHAAEAARTIQTILAEPSTRPGDHPSEAPNRGGRTIPSPRLQRRGLHAALCREGRRPEALRLDCQERIDCRLP